ncbi:MAG: NifB/NifX family molybdenum-iron cluster-binding protein [Dehalococcoidales bacterium]
MLKKLIFWGISAIFLTSGVIFPSGCSFEYPTYIAISAQGTTLDSEVDPNFGVAKWFILIDTETMEYTVIEGVEDDSERGVGRLSAALVAETGVGAVLTGAMGGGAAQVLVEAGVYVFGGVSGTVEYAVEQYKKRRY